MVELRARRRRSARPPTAGPSLARTEVPRPPPRTAAPRTASRRRTRRVLESVSQSVCQSVGWTGSLNNQKRIMACYKCGESGHFASSCPATTSCQCGTLVATLPVMTVRKDGQNRGRTFVKCGQCSFFAWQAPSAPTAAPPARRPFAATTGGGWRPNFGGRGADAAVTKLPPPPVLCSCGVTPSWLTVRKDGPNCGRLVVI